MAKYYDTHCHIDLLKDMQGNINLINQEEIYTIAVTNLPPLYSLLNDKINSRYIRVALGFHPELLDQYKHHIPLMWKLLPSVRYIGEVGLDYKTGNNKELQRSFLADLIDRSRNCSNKIFSFHSRGGESDLLAMLSDDFCPTAILHWFSGSNAQIAKAINQNCYFSINSSMVKTKKGQYLISSIPKSKILIETDSPFTSNKQGVLLNEDIHIIVKAISEILGKSHEDTKSLLWENFKQIIMQ